MPPPPHTLDPQPFDLGGQSIIGTLYLPEGAGWYPAVVLVGDVPGEDLPHFILGLGCAVLTFDAPGAALAQAALAAADSLLMRPDIRPEFIGLLGFGPGAWAAAFVAARAPETGFVVLVPGSHPAAAADLARLDNVHCPVLALASDEAGAAALRAHLAHNDAFTLHRLPATLPPEDGVLPILAPWLQQLMV
jgi:hypothetical protein